MNARNPDALDKGRIKVLLNGEVKQLLVDESGAQLLSEAIVLWGYADKKIAVAINECFVLKQNYGNTLLLGGERIDIVRPINGG